MKEKIMVFKARSELGGKLDENINAAGRPAFPNKKLTNRQIREREFLSLLRKLKPLVADSINTAVKIMKNTEAAHANQLKAATIILQAYKDAVEDTYDKDYDAEEGTEAQPKDKAPVFSLSIVKDGNSLGTE